MENPGGWGGPTAVCEIPSVVGVWIFSGTTHSENQFDFVLLPSEAIWCRIITTTKGREHILNEMYYLAFLYKKN